MCYAVPGKVIELRGDLAVVDYDGITKEVNVSLIEAAVGDYVLVHAGFAIERLSRLSAEQSLQTIREHMDG